MRGALRRHLTYANVVATACLFVLLGGTAYAALTVTGKNVKNGSLTGADVKDHSLLGKDFKKGALPQGKPGAPGAPGPPGPKGDPGSASLASPRPPLGQVLTVTRTGKPPIVIHGVRSSFGGTVDEGKPEFDELVVTGPPLSTGADELLGSAASGANIISAKLEVAAPGGGTAVTLELGPTEVTGIALRGAGDERTQTTRLFVGDAQNKPTNPPKLTWTPGAAALPVDSSKVGDVTGLGGPFDVVSDEWQVDNKASGTGGGGSGKAAFSDFKVVKALDASSPSLLTTMRSQAPSASVAIRSLQPGGASLVGRYTLTTARIDEYHVTIGAVATEELGLSYESIEQNTPAPGGGEARVCWSLPLNHTC